jgi:cell division protein FtsB
MTRRSFFLPAALMASSVALTGCFGRNRVRRRTRRRGNRQESRLEDEIERLEAENAQLRAQAARCR